VKRTLKKRPSTAQVLAALPAATWLIQQQIDDTRARGFVPDATTPKEIARVARSIAAAALVVGEK
jgi:hypothetical protein